MAVDGLAIISTYFRALESSAWDKAVDCFTPSAFYSRPPFPHEPPGSPRHEVRGHDSICTLFEMRGSQPTVHRIHGSGSGDSRWYVAGDVVNQNGDIQASFVSVGTVDERTALLSSYITLVTTPQKWA